MSGMKRIRIAVASIGLLGLAVILLTALQSGRPRVLAIGEVPIAFWSWRTEAPTDAEVADVFKTTNAKALFLRAGQFDLVDREVKRIRPVSGDLPTAPELHLVYNGTRKLLGEFERTDTDTLSRVVADTYRSDHSRADKENVKVAGLQLDLDVPTRLLSRYAELLRRLRELLPSAAALSVTGLPTWADSNEIAGVLEAVDFWIPQCYGSKIPARIDDRIPISSAKEVERALAKIRRLEKPFYAGLSVYGYAILYDKNGDLVELRGDLDPSEVSRNKDLELIATRAFNGDSRTSEIRQEYRATSELIFDGLIIRPGETLVFNLPTSASLRTSARNVRENSGALLLGICLFRLPTEDDKTTLTVDEIAAALADREIRVSTDIRLEAISDRELRLSAKNSGEDGSTPGPDGLTIEIDDRWPFATPMLLV